MTNVTILGTGIMGSGMAHHLLDQGQSVTVWNRNPARAVPLVEAGAAIARTPADAVAKADVVVAMLADDDASRAVWTGQAGALAAMPAHAIAIECSTLTLDWTGTLAAEARGRGIALLDAPVTGSRVQAASGELRFLVGGDADVLERATPVFALLGIETIHLGASGSGAMLKLINNFLCGVQVASLAEALAAVERSGLDPDTAFRLLRTGAPGSPLVNAVGERMLRRAYEPHFLVTLMAKDLEYAREALAKVGVQTTMAAPARDHFRNAAQRGHETDDIAAIIETIRASGGA
jgi:3-hydroxyisobutyrate dehydrogenase